MEGLDKFLTTEPDNGYEKWVDKAMSLIPNDIEIDDDKALELLYKLSFAGARPARFFQPYPGYPSPQFAADVITRRCRL